MCSCIPYINILVNDGAYEKEWPCGTISHGDVIVNLVRICTLHNIYTMTISPKQHAVAPTHLISQKLPGDLYIHLHFLSQIRKMKLRGQG